jgi:hypothetical protein
MSRSPSTHAKQRLTLELPTAVREQMEELRASTHAESVTEVIRRAIAVYASLVSLDGDVHVVVKRNGREEHVLLLRGLL